MNMMIFDLCQNATSNTPRVCTEAEFLATVDSPLVARLVDDFALRGDDSAKRQLPAFCFQAHFQGRRSNANAVSSGLYMLDIDHIEGDAREFGNALVEREIASGRHPEIYLVHITPSGHGLRIVARAEADSPSSLAECQARLANALGVQNDPAVKDLARMSFAVPRATHFLYYNPALFTDPQLKNLCATAVQGSAQNNVQNNMQTNAQTNMQNSAPMQSEYEGMKLADIAAKYFELNGEPPVGTRNVALYRFMRLFRYLCDFRPEVMVANAPAFGLPQAEVTAIARSAAESTRAQQVPAAMREVLAAMDADMRDDGASAFGSPSRVRLPQLPPFIDDFVRIAPDDFKIPTIMACLPPLGALFTGLRARYLDGRMHSPSFMCVVEAPQASGKSFTRSIVDTALAPMRRSDAAERAREEAYRQELRLTKNKAKQPVDPRAVIREVPASISIAKLLQRMDYAGGRHLVTFCEELDTVAKTNRAGAWSEKSDIYRNAFDNAVYGQDYISENTYSASLGMYYNLLACGTPASVRRFFSNAEDGLASRVIFCRLPSQFGREMPRFASLGATRQARLDDIAQRAFEGFAEQREIALPRTQAAMAQWLEQQRLRAVEEADYARDIFRRRAAVTGFRAAMVAAALWDFSERRAAACARFAQFVATQVVEGQMAQFAGSINGEAQAEATSARGTLSKPFMLLPDIFTTADVAAALRRCQRRTPARQMLYLWKINGLAEPDPDDDTGQQWRKCPPPPPRTRRTRKAAAAK